MMTMKRITMMTTMMMIVITMTMLMAMTMMTMKMFMVVTHRKQEERYKGYNFYKQEGGDNMLFQIFSGFLRNLNQI